MNVTQIVAERSDTNASDWAHADGPTTGVGTEYWLVNDAAGKQAYVCVDQGEVASCEITDIGQDD